MKYRGYFANLHRYDAMQNQKHLGRHALLAVVLGSNVTSVELHKREGRVKGNLGTR